MNNVAKVLCVVVCISTRSWGEDQQAPLPEDFATLKALAEKGNVRAQFYTGLRYMKGQGVERDYEQAVKWYRKAADQGDVESQYLLGGMLDFGRGVERNYEEAVKWYKKAAEKGFQLAQTNLAVCYLKGNGVSQSVVTAYIWFSIAAANQDKVAQKHLAFLQDKLSPIQKQTAETLRKVLVDRNPKLMNKPANS